MFSTIIDICSCDNSNDKLVVKLKKNKSYNWKMKRIKEISKPESFLTFCSCNYHGMLELLYFISSIYYVGHAGSLW